MGDCHIQDTTADVAQRGLVAVLFSDGGIPSFLKFMSSSELAEVLPSEQFAKDIAKRSWTSMSWS